jgi:hypothetical protein
MRPRIVLWDNRSKRGRLQRDQLAGLVDGADQRAARKWLVQIGDAARRDRLLPGRLVVERGHEDHRRRRAGRRQSPPQIDPGHAAELNVQEKAPRQPNSWTSPTSSSNHSAAEGGGVPDRRQADASRVHAAGSTHREARGSVATNLCPGWQVGVDEASALRARQTV